MPDIRDSMIIAGSGMKVQSDRLRIIAQNLANADSVALTPGGDPYRRKTITFKNVLDREMGVSKVDVARYGVDNTPFRLKYDPGHPAANAEGYVKMPNVSSIIEIVDMREAQRAYEANLNVIEVSKAMVSSTLQLIR
jgi:flagellar basal-body rod protein FlgC